MPLHRFTLGRMPRHHLLDLDATLHQLTADFFHHCCQLPELPDPGLAQASSFARLSWYPVLGARPVLLCDCTDQGVNLSNKPDT